MPNALDVVRIPALTDNYIWMLHDAESGETVVVDPAEADAVLAEADARGWRISQIWNTHWHADHTGGNAAIKAATGCKITGPEAESARIPTLDVKLAEGDRARIGGIAADILDVPGHTTGHIAFHLPSQASIFVGDVLFAMGCGRLFEGTADQMHANLQRLSALPGDTKVYCGHEYTASNARFALTAEPGNPDIVARKEVVDAASARGEATVPTTIALERATNPFMRARDAAELGALRAAKDSFRG